MSVVVPLLGADASEWPSTSGASPGVLISTDTWYLVYVGSKVQTKVGPFSVENLGIRIEINDGTLVDSTNSLYNARTVTSADMETAYPLWETVATLRVSYSLFMSSLISPSTSPSSSTVAMQEQLPYTLVVTIPNDIYSDGWLKCVNVDGNLVVTPKSGSAIDSSTLRVESVAGSELAGFSLFAGGVSTSYWVGLTNYAIYAPSFSIVSKNLSVNTTSVLHCTTGGSLAPRDYYVTFAITDSWTPCADASCSRVLSSDPNAPDVVAPGGTLNVYVSNGTNSQTTDVYLYFACATTTTCLTNFTGTGPDTYTSGSTSYKGVKISGSTAAFTGVYGTPIVFTANASASSATELVTIQTSNTDSTTHHPYNANIYVRVNVATVTFYSDSTGATAVSTKSAWPTSIAEGATLTIYPQVNQNLAATGTVACTTTSSSITVGGALTVTMTGTELTGDSKWHSGGVYLSGISVTANAVTADTGALAITCAGTGGVATDQVTLYVQVVAKEANLSYSYICDYPSCLVASYVTNPGWLKFGTSVGTQTSWTVGQTLLIYPMIDRDIDNDGTITCYASWSGNDTSKPYAVLGSGSTYSTVSTCTNSGVCQTTSVTLSVKAISGSELASTTGSWRNYGVYGTPMTITGLMYANTITVTCRGSGNDSLSTAPYNFYVLFTPASGANWVTPFRMYTSNTSPPPDSSAVSVNPAYPTSIPSGSTITIYPTLQSSLPSTSTGGSITCSTLSTAFYPDAGKLTVSSSTLAVPGPAASNYVASDWSGTTYTKGVTITASSVTGDSGVIGVACIGTSGGAVYPVSPAGVYLYFKVKTSLPGVTYYSDAAGTAAVSTSSIAPTTVSAGSTLTLYPSFSSAPASSWTVTCTSSDTASLTVSNSGTLTSTSTSAGTQTTGLTLSAQAVTQDKFVTVTCTGDGSVLASTSVQLSLTVQSAAAVFTLYSSNTTASSTTAVSTVITSPTSLAEGSTLTIYPKADRTVAANGTLTCTSSSSSLTVQGSPLTVSSTSSNWVNGLCQSGITLQAQQVDSDTGATVTCSGDGTGLQSTAVTLYVKVTNVPAALTFYTDTGGTTGVSTASGTYTSVTEGASVTVYVKVGSHIGSDGTVTCMVGSGLPVTLTGSPLTVASSASAASGAWVYTAGDITVTGGTESSDTTGTVTCVGDGTVLSSTAVTLYWKVVNVAPATVTYFTDSAATHAASASSCSPTEIGSGQSASFYLKVSADIANNGTITCTTTATSLQLTITNSPLTVTAISGSEVSATSGGWNAGVYQTGITLTAASLTTSSGSVSVTCAGNGATLDSTAVTFWVDVQGSSGAGVTYYTDAAGTTAASTSSAAPTIITTGSSATLYPKINANLSATDTIMCTSSDTSVVTVGNSGSLTVAGTTDSGAQLCTSDTTWKAGVQQTGITLTAGSSAGTATVTCSGGGTAVSSVPTLLYFAASTPSAGATQTASPTPAATATATSTPTVATPAATATATPTPTVATPAATATAAPTPTVATPAATATATPTPTVATPAATATATPTPTVATPAATATATPTPTVATPAPTVATPAATATATPTPTVATPAPTVATPVATATATPTPTVATPAATATATPTPTVATPAPTVATPAATATATPTPTVATPVPTVATPAATATATPTPTVATPAATVATPAATATATPTPTVATPAATATATPTPTVATPAPTVATPAATATATPTPTVATPVPTVATPAATATATPTPTVATPAATATATPTPTVATPAATATATPTPTVATPAGTSIASLTPAATPAVVVSASPTPYFVPAFTPAAPLPAKQPSPATAVSGSDLAINVYYVLPQSDAGAVTLSSIKESVQAELSSLTAYRVVDVTVYLSPPTGRKLASDAGDATLVASVKLEAKDSVSSTSLAPMSAVSAVQAGVEKKLQGVVTFQRGDPPYAIEQSAPFSPLASPAQVRVRVDAGSARTHCSPAARKSHRPRPVTPAGSPGSPARTPDAALRSWRAVRRGSARRSHRCRRVRPPRQRPRHCRG